MKILHIGEYVKGGVGTYVNEIVSYQRQQHHDVYLMVSDKNSETKFNVDSDKLIRYEYQRKLTYFPKTILLIQKKIKEINPDIIHIHSSFAGIFVRLPLFIKKNHLKAKIVYCSHGWSFLMDTSNFKKRFYSLIEKILAKRTHCIINISELELKAANSIISSQKNILIYNGVRDVKKSTNLNKNLLRVDRNKINILFIGRFDRQKGIDVLLEAINGINCNVEFYFIGDAILGEKIAINKKLVNSNFLGWIDNSEIDNYIEKIDCLIVPSRWEGFGLVVLEAMRNSKPALVSNRGALPELVSNKINGYIFDLDNMEKLQFLINNLKKDKLLEMGKNSRKIYEEKFNNSSMNKKIIDLYNELLKK